MINCTLGNMLRCVCIDKQHNCEAALPKVEFTYNNMVNRSIGKTHFEIVYTCSPCDVYDMTVMLTITGGSRAVDNVKEKALQIAEV